MNIMEGLLAGDLKGMVRSQITIDEFKSKLSDDGLVVGIFVQDKDPADDLNRFIQKSSLKLLDTEVSPAPDTNGFYLVFIEFIRDKTFPSLLMELLRMIESLTGIKRWSATCFKNKKISELNTRVLKKNVRLISQEEKTEESIFTFFKSSLLDDLTYENNILTLIREDVRFNLTFDRFCHIDIINSPLVLSEHIINDNLERIIKWLLGEQWKLTCIKEKVILYHVDSNVALLGS